MSPEQGTRSTCWRCKGEIIWTYHRWWHVGRPFDPKAAASEPSAVELDMDHDPGPGSPR